MKKLSFTIFALIALLVTGCTSTVEAQKASPMEFETYTQKVEAETATGFPVSLNLRLAMPVGDGEQQEAVTKGIMELIRQCAINKMLGTPSGNSIKEVGDK